MTDSSAPVRPKARSRARRLVVRLLVLALSLVLAVLLVEWLLGTFGLFGVHYFPEQARYRADVLLPTWNRPDGTPDLDGTLFVQRPNVDVDLGSFRVVTNAHGFRGPELAEPKPEDGCRILVLGDSVAFGWGVDDEVTFLRRFEAALRERSGGRRFEVVNTAIPLYDTVQELAMLERHGLQVDPDVVVLVFVVNDIDPSRDVIEVLLGLREPRAPVVEPTLLDRVADGIDGVLPSLATLLRVGSSKSRDWDALIERHGGEYVPEEFGRGPVGWQRSQDALRRMRDLCRARAVPFVVLDHSFPPVRALPEFCEQEGIPYRELRFTQAETGMPIQNSLTDPHANRLGHDLLLEKLERAWTSLGLPGAREAGR